MVREACQEPKRSSHVGLHENLKKILMKIYLYIFRWSVKIYSLRFQSSYIMKCVRGIVGHIKTYAGYTKVFVHDCMFRVLRRTRQWLSHRTTRCHYLYVGLHIYAPYVLEAFSVHAPIVLPPLGHNAGATRDETQVDSRSSCVTFVFMN